MVNDSEAIRRYINLVESNTGSGTTILSEGVLDNLRNTISNKLGSRERDKLASKLSQEWSKWLGQTDREGTLGDMVRFMKVRVGFNDDDIDGVVSSVTGNSIKGSKDQEQDNEADKDHDGDEEEDDGRPLPKDLNAKMSDYDKVHQKLNPNLDRDVIVDDPSKYMTDGEIDKEKVIAKLNNLPRGSILRLGDREFDFDYGTNEGLIQEKDDTFLGRLSGKGRILSKDTVQQLFNKAAAHINDEYLNNPEKQKQYADANREEPESHQRRRDVNNRYTGSYDKSTMRRELEYEGLSVQAASRLLNKVRDARSVSDLSNQDMHTLAMIGFAFAKARKIQ